MQELPWGLPRALQASLLVAQMGCTIFLWNHIGFLPSPVGQLSGHSHSFVGVMDQTCPGV